MVGMTGGSGGGKTNCFWSATVALSFYISSLCSQKDLSKNIHIFSCLPCGIKRVSRARGDMIT